MNNYLLSIDPSMKNTGFTLWENKKPIWINSFSFKKYNNDNWEEFKYKILKDHYWDTKLIIERGIFNPKFGRGKETLDHLRGFIAGQFNKILTKDMLISPKQWRKWYLNQKDIIDTLMLFHCFNFSYNKNENMGIANHPNNKWNKDLSIKIVNYLSIINNWNITINNHDQAESLLIGWYYLNKENKNGK